MKEKYVSFLRTKILEFMAKYIGIDDLSYVISCIISQERVTKVEYEINITDANAKLKDTYVMSIKLSRKEG